MGFNSVLCFSLLGFVGLLGLSCLFSLVVGVKGLIFGYVVCLGCLVGLYGYRMRDKVD